MLPTVRQHFSPANAVLVANRQPVSACNVELSLELIMLSSRGREVYYLEVPALFLIGFALPGFSEWGSLRAVAQWTFGNAMIRYDMEQLIIRCSERAG